MLSNCFIVSLIRLVIFRKTHLKMTDFFIEAVPPNIASLIVLTFRVVSHTTGLREPGQPYSASHWSIYLIHRNTSTRLSMGLDRRPEIEYPRGRLVITFCNYTDAGRTAVQVWDFPAEANKTVRNVLDALLYYRRDNYSMGENGRGCRYWLYVCWLLTTRIKLYANINKTYSDE